MKTTDDLSRKEKEVQQYYDGCRERGTCRPAFFRSCCDFHTKLLEIRVTRDAKGNAIVSNCTIPDEIHPAMRCPRVGTPYQYTYELMNAAMLG